MEFVKWIVLVVLFAPTDSAPTTTERNSNNPNYEYTKELNDIMSTVFNFPPPHSRDVFHTTLDEYMRHELKSPSKPEKLYNVTLQMPTLLVTNQATRVMISFGDYGNLEIHVLTRYVFVEARSRDFDHGIVTEQFDLRCVIKVTAGNESSGSCTGFDQNEDKLVAKDYQYKPQEETQIKNEIAAYIRREFTQSFIGNDNRIFIFIKLTLLEIFNKVLNNKQERYYSIGTIPSNDYTLNNVIVYGLWNLLSISYDAAHWDVFPTMEMGSVRACMVRNFPSSSDELNLYADKIYISLHQTYSKVRVEFKSYSVVNAKLNTSLANDESKFIIGKIESAFAASIQSAWKSSKKYVPLSIG